MRWIIAALLVVGFAGCSRSVPDPIEPVIYHHQRSTLPVWHPQYETTFVQEYDAGAPETDELEGVQCPVPMENRVRNYTGTQCVFSSTEMLARWAECKELLEPEPITSRSGCRSYSGPSDLESKLQKFGLKPYTEGGTGPMYENSYRSKEEGIKLIKKAMADGRGALFGVPGHAMVLIHYDEQEKIVKYVDNSDRSLKVQTMTMDRFMSRWDSWVCVIYADPDPFPAKAMGLGLAQQIPIRDRNNPQGEYDPGYIPVPKKD